MANGNSRASARLSDQWRNVSGHASTGKDRPNRRPAAEFVKMDCAEIADCRFSLWLFGAGSGLTRRPATLRGQSPSLSTFNEIARNRWLAFHPKSTKSTKVICQHFREA